MLLIKLIQETLNKTQQDIADDLGVSRQTISMWYSGYKISKKNIEQISNVYNLPISFIEQTQISGYSFTNNDIEFIKNCLCKKSIKYNDNVVYTLLSILQNGNIVKSNNFDSWFTSNIDFSNVNIVSLEKALTLSKELKVLAIIKINKKSLTDVMKKYEDLKKKFESNVAYIIQNSNIDEINLLSFGG